MALFYSVSFCPVFLLLCSTYAWRCSGSVFSTLGDEQFKGLNSRNSPLEIPAEAQKKDCRLQIGFLLMIIIMILITMLNYNFEKDLDHYFSSDSPQTHRLQNPASSAGLDSQDQGLRLFFILYRGFASLTIDSFKHVRLTVILSTNSLFDWSLHE